MTRKDKLTNFMLNKDAEKKGQKVNKKEKEEEEDFLPNPKRPTRQKIESASRNDDGILLIRKILHILVMIPIIIIGIASISYIAIKILPPIVGFIRKLIIILLLNKS
jgi:hypothetical protein